MQGLPGASALHREAAHRFGVVGVAAVPGKPAKAEDQGPPGGADQEGCRLQHQGRDPPHRVGLEEVAGQQVRHAAPGAQEGLPGDGGAHGRKLRDEFQQLEEALCDAGNEAQEQILLPVAGLPCPASAHVDWCPRTTTEATM